MSSRILPGTESGVRSASWRNAGTRTTGAYPGNGESRAPTTAHPTGSAVAGEPQEHVSEKEIQARVQAAFQRGVAEGDATGAQRAAAQITPVLKSFSAITQELSTARSRARSEAEASMVQLALAIAKRVLRREISMDPDAILGLVRAGMDKVNAREIHRLRLATVDADFVQQNRAQLDLPPSVEVMSDPSLLPGSAVFETTRGELDASALTQLEEIERGLTDVMARRQH